jgi:hypothetical protein
VYIINEGAPRRQRITRLFLVFSSIFQKVFRQNAAQLENALKYEVCVESFKPGASVGKRRVGGKKKRRRFTEAEIFL